jgi:hypothetical protein
MGFELEFTRYKLYARRDVNNYAAVSESGKVKSKGIFATPDNIKDTLRKGFKFPIVTKCLRDFFVDGVPVEDTLAREQDILSFSASQKSGAQFSMELHTLSGIQKLQKTNRFCISRAGGSLVKRHTQTGKETRLYAGQYVTLLNDVDENLPISAYNLDMEFYVREANDVINAIRPKVKQLALFG